MKVRFMLQADVLARQTPVDGDHDQIGTPRDRRNVPCRDGLFCSPVNPPTGVRFVRPPQPSVPPSQVRVLRGRWIFARIQRPGRCGDGHLLERLLVHRHAPENAQRMARLKFVNFSDRRKFIRDVQHHADRRPDEARRKRPF
jgi:hypothetical protein